MTTIDELVRELAEARAEITTLREQIAEIREGYETRIAKLREELARVQPSDDPWEQRIRNWLDEQQGESRHASWRILENALGIDRQSQDSATWRRLKKVMAKIGWRHALVPDDHGSRIKGYRKHRY